MNEIIVVSNQFNPYVVKAHKTGYPLNGVQVVMRFPNGYGASVIKNSTSYGEIEIAVIRFNSDDDEDWTIVYDTSVAHDVIGCDDAEHARNVLNQILNLEAK